MGNFCSTLFEDRKTQANLKKEQQTERIIAGQTGGQIISTSANVKESPVEEQHYRSEKLNIPLKTNGSKSPQPLEQFIKTALEKHNFYRKKHNAPELKLNSELSKLAQTTADEMALKDDYDHSHMEWHNVWLGENMAIMIGQELAGDVMTDICSVVIPAICPLFKAVICVVLKAAKSSTSIACN